MSQGGHESRFLEHPSSDIRQPPLEHGEEGSPLIREGGGHPSITAPPLHSTEVQSNTRPKGVVSAASLLDRYRSRTTDAGTLFWGQHVRAGMVTFFVGETSAGKTVFLHNLAHHLATGREFLGLTPPRPLRVLYVDFETPPEVLVEHLTVMGVPEGWDFFEFDGEAEL